MLTLTTTATTPKMLNMPSVPLVFGFAFGAAGIWVAAVVVGDNWPIRGSG